MGNHIKFEASGGQIVQVDDAFKSRVVVFECNEEFSIEFVAKGNTFYDPEYNGADQPINSGPVTFESKEYRPKEDEESLHKIRIKFSNIDHAGGYKYTVIVKRRKGLDPIELDPRICPK